MAKRSTRRRASTVDAFDPPSGARVCAWIEANCFIMVGATARPIILEPWQWRWISGIYDCPTRRAILSTPRKNSKTLLTACLALCHLCGVAARPGTELYSTALSREQAGLLYRMMATMVRLNAVLARLVRIRETAKELYCADLHTRFRALSSDESRSLGLNPSFVACDELGSVVGPSDKLYEALDQASSAQPNPLSVIISTQSASDTDLLSILLDDAPAGHDP